MQLSYDNVGNLCEIAPSPTTTCASASSPYATGYGYDAAGQLTGLKYGNGIYASIGYASSNREQLSCLDYSTTNRNGTCAHDSTTKFGLSYLDQLWTPNMRERHAPGNDGQIQCITDSVDSGRTANYTYDALGRLSRALTNGSTGFPQWGYTWTYDQYGNRLCQNISHGRQWLSGLLILCLSWRSANESARRLVLRREWKLTGQERHLPSSCSQFHLRRRESYGGRPDGGCDVTRLRWQRNARAKVPAELH